MKQINLLLLFTLSFMALMISCSDEGPALQNPDEKEPDNTATDTEYYISYKIDGTLISMVDSKGLRGKEGDYNTLTLEGSGKDGAHPKFRFYHSGSFIGIVGGLNFDDINSQNSSSYYLEITTQDGVLYSSKNDPEGCYLAITAKVTYTKDGTVEGKFNGFVSSEDSKRLEITDGRYKVKFAN